MKHNFEILTLIEKCGEITTNSTKNMCLVSTLLFSYVNLPKDFSNNLYYFK
jgi:hypothetical protein